jgi:manganese/iron transport system substrate-binding protein
MLKKLVFISFFLFSLLPGCRSSQVTAVKTGNAPGENLVVVATTTIVGDVVHNVGGDAISLSVLLPVGTDPHSFQPAPQDVAKVARARMVIMNGAGLEEFMKPLLENAGRQTVLVDASQGIKLLQAPAGGDHQGGDPHVWMDPNNVMVWVKNVEAALSKEDPNNTATFHANAEVYLKSLEDLDAWVREQVSQVPQENRKLVTDHQDLGYFANRYGFQIVGSIIPGFSTEAEPSAQELASLEDSIRSLGIKSIFVGKSFNHALAQRVAGDTHTQIVVLLSGSLTETGGEADNYLDYIRYDVNAVVAALK